MSETYRPTESKAEQLRHKAADLKEDIVEVGKLSKEYAGEKLQDLGEKAARTYQRGRQRAGELQENVQHYVSEQPVKSLLIALGAGLLLGFFWRRG
jgi:ElaB/YqjD/DUF883 family membrane-anchored ribosome-binding protein